MKCPSCGHEQYEHTPWHMCDGCQRDGMFHCYLSPEQILAEIINEMRVTLLDLNMQDRVTENDHKRILFVLRLVED
jgi:hypothetical protein